MGKQIRKRYHSEETVKKALKIDSFRNLTKLVSATVAEKPILLNMSGSCSCNPGTGLSKKSSSLIGFFEQQNAVGKWKKIIEKQGYYCFCEE